MAQTRFPQLMAALLAAAAAERVTERGVEVEGGGC
jgi:hypothetical protein